MRLGRFVANQMAMLATLYRRPMHSSGVREASTWGPAKLRVWCRAGAHQSTVNHISRRTNRILANCVGILMLADVQGWMGLTQAAPPGGSKHRTKA